MDTYSASQAARVLGTSAPRVLRAVQRLGMRTSRTSSGALAITEPQLGTLAAELGTPPPGGLSRTQARVLAALARSPRGLASIRAVARRAGVSPVAAGRALRTLIASGLAASERRTLALGSVQEADVYTAQVTAPPWPQLAPHLARIDLPAMDRPAAARTVPYYLRHLFWNTAPSQLDISTSASYIAKRLLATGDPDGLAWGVTHLPASAWESAAQARGLDPCDRALASNLASNLRAAA